MATNSVVPSVLTCDRFPSGKAVAERLPNQNSTHGSWMLADDFPASLIGRVHDTLRYGPTQADIIKRDGRRLVARMADSRSGLNVVVKAVSLRGIRKRWLWRCPTWQEATNQACAEERGILVPRILAYGQVPGRGNSSHRILCTQWRPYRCMRELFLEGVDAEDARDLLQRAASPMRTLFVAGCNHVDFGPHAILMHPQDSTKDAIIDFESATFLRRPSTRVLAAQLGYFGWSVAVNRDWVSRHDVITWRDHVLRDVGVQPTKMLVDIFDHNMSSRRKLHERMNRR